MFIFIHLLILQLNKVCVKPQILLKNTKGALGAIPEPDLINTLISIHNDTVKGGTSSDDE